MNKNILIWLSAIFISLNSFAQNNFWAEANASNFRSELKDRVSNPNAYRTVSLDVEAFLNFANNARNRFDFNQRNSLVLTLPMPNGENETFTLENSELMHPDLAARFPELKTYSGKGIDDKTASIRITYSPYFGFSGMILSGKHSTVYIDPITQDHVYYMSYYRNNLQETTIDFTCYTDENGDGFVRETEDNQRADALGDCNLRRYRLAQSCTGEYAQYHIGQAGGTTGTTAGDKAIVQAAMNVALNRVNGVYERDLGITLQFIPNNDAVIYLVANTDPWTNEWNTRTAQTLDAVIGVNNYDIGHNFNTTGGGNAGCLDCVCLSNSQNSIHKGRGYTGLSAPVGDPFYIDYVAHEMGHQFGGYHTQSNSSCRSGSGATEVEPGSGSTIMGYAGICSINVQNQSDDYFAYVNIRDIVSSINYGNGSGCAEIIVSGNTGPTADAGLNYSIPRSTPFKLEGIGTDANDSGLTYCWEQNDPENPNSNAAPISTRTVGPMFRSLSPVAEPYRYMPNITAIVNNTSPTFEVLPSISRSMEFSFIVRDNNSVSGCTASDLMSVTTVASAGPFVVSTPNTNVTWNAGTTQNVSWDVANTTAAPISCANVDIFLSTDGGFTYPITIATSVTNNGSYNFVVPNNQGNQNRIMVKGANNIFFDISNTNFTIGPPIVCNANVPVGLSASNIGSTTATLSWNAVSGATYDLRYREVGNPTWTTFPVLALTSNLSGLTPITNYEAQVRSMCSGGTTSAYSSSEFFTTTDIPACTGTQITSYPYLETFDSGIGAWTQATGDNGNWTLDANGTPTNNTGPSNDITGGGNYFYLEANGLAQNQTAILVSPCYDLSSLSEASFSFYYHLYGNNQMGTLNIEITADNGINWANIFSVSGNQGNQWNTTTIDLTSYVGQVVKLRFIGIRGSGNRSDMAIDQIGLYNTYPLYCTSNGSSTNFEYINRVELEAIDNINSGPGITNIGYSDFTNISTDLYNGRQYTITITPEWTGATDPEGYAVWIDYNNDGDFTDSGEQVWTQAPTYAATVSGSFTVPSNIAFEESTRMRVSLKYNGIPTSCETFAYGEVEDYTINLKYDDSPVYCASNGNNTNDEYIGRVQLGTIDNNNLSPGITSIGYSNYTNLSTDLYSGRPYTITITPEWTGTAYSEGYSVWIDYNNDGDFNDSGEQVFTQAPTNAITVSGNFSVPDNIAFQKSTRMRVSLKYNGIPTSCESFPWGEVEDYTINLKYDGLLYLNNNWYPNAPTAATGNDNALIFNNTYNVNADVAVNNLTVNSIAAIEIPGALSMYVNGNLINNGGMTLNSVSNQYSSLIVTGSTAGDVSYKRHVNVNANSGGNDLISAPVTGQTFGVFASVNENLFSNPSNPSEKLFGPFDKATETYLTYDTDIPAEAAAILNPGIGYRAASSDNGTLTFKGTVNTGIININIFNSGTVFPEWNLIGNPYPSYITLSDFLNTNINEFLSSSAAIYGYNDDTVVGGKWTILNLAYSQANPNEKLTPGQGFLVSSKLGGGNITFSPSFRAIGSNDDFIIGRETQAPDIAYLKLQMASASNVSSTDFYFTDNASRGLDVGYDAPVFNNVAPAFAFYSALVEENEGKDIAIQSVGYNEFTSDIIIPLGINAAQGQQLTISIENSDLPSDIDVYLEDNVANTFTLLNNSNYVFTAATSLYGTGRFFLRFESETLTNPEYSIDALSIFTTRSPKTITIKGLIKEHTVAKLYDIQGRLVLSSELKKGTNRNEIDTDKFSLGVYVIKLESATQGKTQKIIIR